MLDLNFIRQNPEQVKTAASQKNLNPDVVDEVLRFDERRRRLLQQVEALRAQKNQLNRDQIDQGRLLKQQLKDLEPELRQVEASLENLMLQVPNIPAADVPVGPDESANQIIKTWGDTSRFGFNPKTHDQLALDLDLYDTKRAVSIAGTRAYYLKSDLVMLEQAVLNHALRLMIAEGFTPFTVPWMVNRDALVGTGYFPWGEEDHYRTQDDQGLIGTAEVSLTAFGKDTTYSYKDLPVKMCAISPCFRREVGSYGKDTQGFFRLHQFTKVEMVVYTQADENLTRQMHDYMLSLSERFLQELQLPYQVLVMSTGDMGAGQRKKYDIETWFPGQDRYRETHSDSYFNDFQARRLNIRYQAQDNTKPFVYTLNNTVAASPRILAAILENYQQADGSVKIPTVLQSFMGKEVISGR